jgi:hypothetical protein
MAKPGYCRASAIDAAMDHPLAKTNCEHVIAATTAIDRIFGRLDLMNEYWQQRLAKNSTAQAGYVFCEKS